MEVFTDLKAIRFIPGTKVSHDYQDKNVNTFSYRELMERRVEAIGIPCRENGLIVIDVDIAGANHKHDGREFWTNFCVEYGIPQTYTVQTQSGGYHFYFRLPPSLNLDLFSPPATLAPGVDVKFRGWVGAPPTPGYTILKGNLTTVAEVPASLLAFMSTAVARGTKTFDSPELGIQFTAHKPFSEVQIKELRQKILWLQSNGTLDRSEWRDGLFALKAGIDDPELLDEMVDMWTVNQSYVEGDEVEAKAIVDKADKYGPIGPGTLFAILKAVARREGAVALDSPYTSEEVINRSKVAYSFTKEGALRVETSESNAASLIGALYDVDMLYHDIRSDVFVFKGTAYSDRDLVNILIPQIQSPHSGLGLEKFRRAQIAAGLDVLLASRQLDPHLEFLKKLVWDGVPRIEQFFQNYVGAEDTEYHRKVSKNMWVAMAARGLKPGCKFDSIIIIEGAEGVRKSSLVEAIGGEYTFAPARRDSFENLDELRKMHQSVVVELPELMGLANESPEKVKAFLASPFDLIRGLYERKAIKQLRGFILIGTTNSDKYISKTMGLRRFWPVKIPASTKVIDVDKIKAERGQLFAEAIQYFRDGYPFYEMPPELLSVEAESKVVNDPLIAAIKESLYGMSAVTIPEIFQRLNVGGFLGKGLTPAVGERLQRILSNMEFTEQGDKWVRPTPEMPVADFFGFDVSQVV